MSKIKPLPPELISKIAAGEVVERPASVVKELVENSLDARASNIKIEIFQAGTKKIAVMDDGLGMDKDDLLECFKPHTTSKLFALEDLDNIKSLGFRGEALSSISAVSTLTIKSKTATDSLGALVKIQERKILENHSVGMPQGTQVIVENLFEPTPARKKFLKPASYEIAQIISLCTRLAIASPKVGFTLTHNNRIIFILPAEQTLGERTKILLGNKIFSRLLPIKFQNEYLALEGFIGTPQIANRLRNRQFFFVNSRSIKSAPIVPAVKAAYKNLLMRKMHPVFLLSLKIPPECMDVNIHPRKEEVKFSDPRLITNFIEKNIKKTLEKNNLVYRPLDYYPMENYGEELIIRDKNPTDKNYTAKILKETVKLWQPNISEKEESIIQINNLYLVAKTAQGIIIIDQHAAHERILYEELFHAFENIKKERGIYPLEQAVVFDLPLAEVPYMLEKIETFKSVGFDIEPFGSNSFKIGAIPGIFRGRNISDLIAEVLDDLIRDESPSPIDVQSEKIISYLACRSAIKSGDYLKPLERQNLINKLKKTKSKYTCPHGRPVQIEIPLEQLDMMFRRK